MRGKSADGTINNHINCTISLSYLTFIWLFQLLYLSSATDTLTSGQILKDWQFLVSPNKFFQLGFYYPLPLHSTNRFLAIRCMDNTYDEFKLVWVANRESPLKDSSGYLNITRDGFLVIRDERGTSITINKGQPATQPNSSLTIFDSGNLVLKSGEEIVWQSFDHPTDTILPGMKIGLFDLKSESQPRKRFLTSWVGQGDPFSGAFTLGVNLNNTKQLEVRRRGQPFWRSPTWNRRNQSNNNDLPFQTDFDLFIQSLNFTYTSNENESYFSYSLINSNYSWIEIDSNGEIQIFLVKFSVYALLPEVSCNYKLSMSEGCIVQKAEFKCSGGDEFMLVDGSMSEWSFSENITVSLSDCEDECRSDCSCMGYASYSPDGSGCKFSKGPLLGGTESFYARAIDGKNETRAQNTTHKVTPKKKQLVIIVGVVVSFGLIGLVSTIYYYIIRKKIYSQGEKEGSRNSVDRDTQKFISELGTCIAAMDESNSHNLMIKRNMEHELPLFSFSTIETATEKFSEANKLGQGGFGPVFKGKLSDGKEIAVKRLSERSSQGIEEFKNEVVLISKVQHRNLVRLYGCCIKGEEKLLIYEYLPNKSLDTFLLDETRRLLLNWKLRINIIEGIAQGLLYLHKYSRMKIIHRDLKTSNILLDNSMNPKISDFGTAKIFGENESRANTCRIVGTYGYMSPEYAMDGLFSVKSDVFSFGVMLLEIISGKKNTGFYHSNQSLNLTRHAWNLWKEKKSLELMDSTLDETYSSTIEFERCVQIALLCVQEDAADRPTMSDVVSMLSGSDMGFLPEPKQSNCSAISTDHPHDHLHSLGSSVNNVTISTTYAR